MKLTERELDVLRGYADGGDHRTIAERLGIASNTVRAHVRGLKQKLGAGTIAQAVHLAHEEGLLARPTQAKWPNTRGKTSFGGESPNG